ncbi:MAG TPA: universal stress protein [Alphaproteobacteria bacterium]|nr:universal stress protein [Alphaproteobacteria bacterium]
MPGYRNLLVHLDAGTEAPERLKHAAALAARFDAHLTGLALVAEPSVAAIMGGPMPSAAEAEMLEKMREQRVEAQEQRAGQLRARFDDAVRAEGIRGDFQIARTVAGHLADTLAVYARYFDLAILGQEDPEAPDLTRLAPAEVVLSSGRPALVLPAIPAPAEIGRHVLVAWDAGQAATRAVNDAMPLLQQAETVTVVTINAEASETGHGALPGADIALHLARHEVEASVQELQNPKVSEDQALLSYAADVGADMMVMGAYGHSRLREWVLGGVTRGMLRTMTLPLLLSH